MLIMVVLIGKIAGLTAIYQKRTLEASAKRLSYLEQVVESSKAVKFFSWEEPYIKLLEEARSTEMGHVYNLRWVLMLSVQMSRVLPIASAAFTVAVMVAFDMELKPANIFSTIAVFMSMRLAIVILPQGSSAAKQALVSFHRIQDFLLLPESPERNTLPEASSATVEIESIKLAWPTSG